MSYGPTVPGLCDQCGARAWPLFTNTRGTWRCRTCRDAYAKTHKQTTLSFKKRQRSRA